MLPKTSIGTCICVNMLIYTDKSTRWMNNYELSLYKKKKNAPANI